LDEGGAVLGNANGPGSGIACAEGAIDDTVAIAYTFIEDDLVVVIGIGETGCRTVVATCSPFYIEGAVRSGACGAGKDTVITGRPRYLVYLKRENRRGEAGVGQTAAVEGVAECAKRQVAVRACQAS